VKVNLVSRDLPSEKWVASNVHFQSAVAASFVGPAGTVDVVEVLKAEVDEGEEIEVILELRTEVFETLVATTVDAEEVELRGIEAEDTEVVLVTGRRARDVEELLGRTDEADEMIEVEVLETTDEEEGEAVEFGRV